MWTETEQRTEMGRAGMEWEWNTVANLLGKWTQCHSTVGLIRNIFLYDLHAPSTIFTVS